MARPPVTNRTAHKPGQEDCKSKGKYYGGARRADAGTDTTPTVSPVQQAFAAPENQPDTWQHRTDARTGAGDIRANSTNSGWAK